MFKPAVLSCLHYTTQSSKAIVPALYMLAGMAMGTEESLETVYRFLMGPAVAVAVVVVATGSGRPGIRLAAA